MKSFVALCRDLFLLSQTEVAGHGLARGLKWESRIADYLALQGLPVEAHPGGFMVLGHASLSGLLHQIDGTIGCNDAIVIGEWKAYRGSVPKNELLRFKAATDDYFMALANHGLSRPIMRVFGGTGSASDELRAYGALHGITLIEPDRWPAPVLLLDNLLWQNQHALGPGPTDSKTLIQAFRPLQDVLIPQLGGGYLVRRPLSRTQISATLFVHDLWSYRLWEAIDSWPGRFEEMVSKALCYMEVRA
jgi:hypothetical protein